MKYPPLPPEQKRTPIRCPFLFNEINPFRDLWNILRMWNMASPYEIRLRRVKGFISFHRMRSIRFHNDHRSLFHICHKANISLFPFLLAPTPTASAKKEQAIGLLFFYPSRRLGISSRDSVYIIAVGVYHQPKAVYPAAWWDTTLRVDDMPFLRNGWYTPTPSAMLNVTVWRF